MTKKPKSANTKSTKAMIALMAWFAFCWSWTLSTDSLSLSGSHTQGLIIAIIVSIVIVSLSTIIMYQGMKVVRRLFTVRPPRQALLMSLPLFALFDFLVAWITTIIWISPQGNIDNILPFSSPTLLLINTPFGFASRIVGFFGLAAFGWLIIILLVDKQKRKLALLPLIMLSILSLFGWISYRNTNGSTFQAKIISETLFAHVPAIDATKTKLVIFPEYGLDFVTNTNLTNRIYSKGQGAYFVGSKSLWQHENNSLFNTLVFGNTEQGITQTQNKHRLIPGGEDLPYIALLILRSTNQTNLLNYFAFTKAITKGNEQLKPLKIDDKTTVGAAVCSSIISPIDYRHLTQHGATILSNSASLEIFGDTLTFDRQQKSLGQFMAVANARYFLQSANGDRAYAIDHNGRTIAETSGHRTLDVTVQNNSKKTPYTRFGEWLAWAGAVVALWLLAIRKKTSKHQRPK